MSKKVSMCIQLIVFQSLSIQQTIKYLKLKNQKYHNSNKYCNPKLEHKLYID